MNVTFDDINKISTNIMWLSSNTILRVTANLWSVSKKYGRSSYHRETRFYYDKAGKQVVNINLDIDVFATIEQLKPNERSEKCYIRLNTTDLYYFRNAIESMFQILNSDYNSIFGMKNGHARVQKKMTPIEVKCSCLNSYLVIQPDIIENHNGDEHSSKGGIRINLSSPTNYVLLDMNGLITLKETLAHLSLPMYGQALINYLGAPKLGEHMYQVGDAGDGEGVVNPNNRTLDSLTNKKESYFNKYNIL